MALEAGVDPTMDLTDEIELDFSIEMLQENTVELVVDPIPAAFELVGGQLMFDLGADGTLAIGTPPTSTGGPLEIRLPDVSAAPFDQADAFFSAYAGQDVEDDADNFPNASRIVRDVTVEVAIGSGVEIDDLLEPPLDLSWYGDGLSLTMPGEVSYGGAHVEDENEDVLWGATVFDPPVDSIALPEFPADWGWDGLPDGYLYLETGAAVIEGDVNEMVFDELWHDLVASSENMLEVE
jgi:hypothetical protein